MRGGLLLLMLMLSSSLSNNLSVYMGFFLSVHWVLLHDNKMNNGTFIDKNTTLYNKLTNYILI